MELRKDAKYAMIIPTSMGIRITPINGQPVHSSDLFKMTASSAESNVGSTASYLGLPVKILTTFVKGSPIARLIKDNLASRHMDYEGPELEQDNPWGYVTRLILQTAATDHVAPAYKMIVQVKLVVH